ncbi:MAG: hypothetical protein JO161_10700 [Planctomycetaceae bacterium]|nr:hypothetical protein [Planctomycetaceae bacterium]
MHRLYAVVSPPADSIFFISVKEMRRSTQNDLEQNRAWLWMLVLVLQGFLTTRRVKRFKPITVFADWAFGAALKREIWMLRKSPRRNK